MDVNYHGDNKSKKIDINDIIKASDYHFILCFKNDKVNKKLNIEIIDPRIDKNFKIACIDKAIDFLEILRSKLSGDSNEDVEKMMNRKQARDIPSFVSQLEAASRIPTKTLTLPPVNDELNFVMQTFDDYFKGIKIDKKLLAGDKSLIFRITSDAIDAKFAFDKFKSEFWDRYYSEILKAKLGSFTITFQFGK